MERIDDRHDTLQALGYIDQVAYVVYTDRCDGDDWPNRWNISARRARERKARNWRSGG